MSKSLESGKIDKRKSKSGKNSSGPVMAPAILVNGKTENKNSKLSTKQNMKKMDPKSPEPEEKRGPIDIAALKLQLSSEDLFISSLLTNIPTQGVSTVQDVEGDEISVDNSSTKKVDVGNRACNPEELKERLAAKLSQFTGKKMDFSDKKMKTKLKRKLDKIEKKKLKRKNNKMRSKIAKLAQATKAATASSNFPSTETVKTEVPEPTVTSRPPKPIFNSEGRMVFSKFDFGELTTPSPILKKTTLDPKAAMIKIKKTKEKVKFLEAKGDIEKARSIEEQQAWEGALLRAEGVKVKDNVELLAKSIKKKDKIKLQSKKKWGERVEAQEKKKEDVQKKRNANIKKKKNEKKEHKLNKLAKKGKFIV
ncbi:surfeit locus protein 6 homolog [Daphnia pulex]|uniref:surfeit locus protein 6 homolog n=1 Tax=Daphnia pulex TaxID=6669 RepID=UPI001EE02BDA|nr:surfeit locus protein 6 homolog [Daphnia pulex]